MKKYLIALIFLIIANYMAWAQSGYQNFHETSVKVNQTGMVVLGSWAVVNIAVGAAGWSKYNGSAMRFHQMNLFWNTVNLSIAGFAFYNYLQNSGAVLTPDEIMQEHLKAEKLYMVNAGLDVLYIGTGFLLRHLSARKEKNKDILLGYGNSILLQGSFLLVFDAVMWGIQRSNRLDFLGNADLSFAYQHSGFQLGLALPF